MSLLKSFALFFVFIYIFRVYRYIHFNKSKRLLFIIPFFALLFIKYYILTLLILLVLFIYNFFHKKSTIKRKNKVLNFYGYKIFKFLINQISSGILVTDAIQSMYMIVSDDALRGCLVDLSATYSQTNNLNQALQVLRSSYKGDEVDAICIAIEQAIYSGSNPETLEKMEALLFKKYIYFIRNETKLRKRRSILSVFYFCMVIILLISIPMFMDIIKAYNQIF